MLAVAVLIFAAGAVLPVGVMIRTESNFQPALSLDRIHIEYSHGKGVMISPQQKEQFMIAPESRRKAVA